MRGNVYLVGFVLVALVAVLNLPAPVSARVKSITRDNFLPFQDGLSFFTDKIRQVPLLGGGGGNAGPEKERLFARIASLENEVRELHALERENDDLRRLLGFERRQRHRLALCRVISRGDVSGWWQSVRLNRGRDVGIGPGMAVLTPEGLVGRTVEAGHDTCDVLLLSDPNCRVACRFDRTGALGIARGGGVSFAGRQTVEMLVAPNPFRVDYVAKDLPVATNDVVLTSGLGGVFPEGLPVGRVMKVGLDASGLYQRAELRPSADLAALTYVFVVVQANARPVPLPATEEGNAP